MPNVVAYDLYLRVRHEIWRLAEDSLDRAMQLLENGLNLVGDNVLLFAGMGYVNLQYVNAGIRSDERYLKKGECWASRVLEPEPNDARGYLLPGLVQLTRGELQEGVTRLKRAHALDPNDPDILAWLGGWCTVVGKMETGRSLIRRLSEIDPLTSSTFIWRAAFNYYEGRFEEATQLMKEAYRLEPESPAYRFFYFIMLAANNDLAEASILAEEYAQQVTEDFLPL